MRRYSLTKDGQLTFKEHSGKEEEIQVIKHITDEELRHLDVDYVFFPMMVSLQLFGAQPREAITSGSWNTIVLLLIQLRAFLMLVNFTYYLIMQFSLQNLTLHSMDAFIVAVAGYSVHHFRVKSWAVINSLRQMNYFQPLSFKTIKVLRRWALALAILSWLHAVCLIIVMEWSLNKVDIQKYLDTYLFGAHFPKTNIFDRVAFAIVVVDWIVVIVINSLPIFFMMFYSLICRYLAAQFATHFQQSQAIAPRLLEDDEAAKRFRDTSVAYFRIRKSVETVNNVFDSMVFCWYMLTMVITGMVVYDMIITAISPNRNASYHFYLPIALFSVFSFVMMSMTADKMTVNGKQLLPTLYGIALQNAATKGDLYFQARTLITNIVGQPPVLTAWDCFVMSRALIITVVSLMATYIVIVLQLTAPKTVPT